MSYNTQWNDYDARMHGYAQPIKNIAPAIVGLQECQNRDGLARLAGSTALTGTGYCNYIMHKPSMVTPVTQGAMRIPRDDYAERCISYAQFKFGDSAIWFFNTHLPHNHNEASSQSTHATIARMLVQKRRELGAENSPTIVVGDFNPHASNWNKAPEGGFRSNLQANGFTHAYESQGSLRGYDHIMYSTAHWTHQNCRDTGTGGSDHTSIACDLVLK
jgi:endonuclease/exonuclease/phosphatase family metal-dependent hydrolase